METHLFDRLQDSVKLQTTVIYDILHHVLEDHHFDLTSNSKGNTEPLYNRHPKNNNLVQTPHLTVRRTLNLLLLKWHSNNKFQTLHLTVTRMPYPLLIQTLPLPLLNNYLNNKLLAPHLKMTKTTYDQNG
jgi:hypothetical protein